MSEQTATTEERIEKLQGLGCARKRVEDARFTQGKGNYVDDVKLPGMVFGDFVRSPYGHARIRGIDKEAALAAPGVLAVLTAEDLKPLNLHYMPTLAGDVQAVLADEKVLFQGQEVAFVVADDRYAAADAVELVEVEYEELPALTDAHRSMDEDAPVLREDIADKAEGAHGPRRHPNHVFTWEAGDRAATEQALAGAEVVAEELIVYQRVHPCPLETCGCVASMDKVNGKLTLWGTFQAPHAVRTVASLITNIPEHNIRIVSPDIGGGFGNKVGVYPGYICAAVASIVLGRPVKWIEDRMENLSATAFARDYHMSGKIAATRDGRITGLQCHVLADHGAFDACADPTKFPAGFFNICTGSYDVPSAYVEVDGVYTNKAPGGVAYRCSFRVTEASYFIERMVDVLARKLDMDPAELRRRNLIPRDRFPYTSALGWEYDSGDYHAALDKALAAVDYPALRAEQKAGREAFARGETRSLMGIGVAFFTEIVGAGPVKNCDILGLGMFDSCEIRIHPTGSATARLGTISQGQGHATTFAQILASETGIPADRITVEEGEHRHRPLRPRHLRVALDPGGRRRHGDGRAQDPGQGPDDRRLPARSARGRPRMGRGPLPGQGQPRAREDHGRDRVRRLQPGHPGARTGPRSGELLRSAQHDLPLRGLRLRGGRGRGHRGDGRAALLRPRRLRHPHQPDDHRRAGARRPDRGAGHRDGPGDRLRRDGQRVRRQPAGLLPAHRGRDPGLGDRLHHHPLAAPPDRREGGRREPERGRRLGLLQRGERRLRASRPHARADAARPLAGVGDGGTAGAAWMRGW